jgi:serine/threonine protein kinase
LNDDDCFLEFDSLGPNLGELFLEKIMRTKQWGFSLKTVLMIADQVLTRLETLHSTGWLHGGVKPDNVAIGSRDNDEHNVIYLIDLGASRRFLHGKHHVDNDFDGPIGNRWWMFKHVGNGSTPSRRDDLGSLAYMLSFFLKGELPWMYQGASNACVQSQKCRDQTKLFEGNPDEFAQYLKYCDELEFDEKPDYDYCRGLFRKMYQSHQFSDDGLFDWATESWGQ